MKNHKEDSRRKFDQMASDYESSSYGSLSKELYEKAVLKVGQFVHKSVLDLGCGNGIFLEKLKRYGSELYGADISPEMIKYARKRLGEDVEMKVTDSENLPWADNSFDVITCILSFHHYPDPAKSLKETKRVLKKDGRLIVGELWIPALIRIPRNWYLRSRYNKSGDVKIYSKNDWIKMLVNAGFNEIEVEKAGSFTAVITSGINK
jgi:ubiquinone/menaquinone biosynthesis C-methylase UbiE